MSSRRPRHNLGRVDWIGVEAIGLPGERTFRLLALAQGTLAHLWLEKEQLQALSDALARLVAEIEAERSAPLAGLDAGTLADPKPPGLADSADVELHIGALGLRYDPQKELIALEVFERGAEESDPPVLRCLAARAQVESLQKACLEVISAGRPRCPFCGAPLSAAGIPHFCPPTNGHQKVTTD